MAEGSSPFFLDNQDSCTKQTHDTARTAIEHWHSSAYSRYNP